MNAPESIRLPLFESRLRVPVQRPGTVSRSALVERLRNAWRAPVVVIASPAGYGKTTVIAEWAEHDQRPFGTYSIDAVDNDPVVFLTYLAAALNRAGADVDHARELAASGRSTDVVVTELVRGLASLEAPGVVVLDNVDALENRACLDALGALFDHVPSRSQLVLVTRSELDLPLADVRAQGRLLELDDGDLRLSGAEAGALLHAVGVTLADDDMQTLIERCGGWAAGLYLAALATRASSRVPEGELLGADRFISDYFRLEVLDALDSDDRDFVLKVSVVDALCGPLCDAMLDRSDSTVRLQALAQANLFLVPVGHEAQWFQLHPLFRDMLQGELVRRHPGSRETLLERAIDWHVARGDPEAALECAISAGDRARVATLFTSAVMPTYWSGRFATVERWCAAIDDPQVLADHPAAAAVGATMLAQGGRPQAAERWARAAFQSDENAVMPDGSRAAAWVANLRAFLCVDGVEAMRRDAQLAVETFVEGSPFAANAWLLLGFAHWFGGNDEAAEEYFAASVALASGLGASAGAAGGMAALSLLAAARGEAHKADDLIQRAQEIVQDAHLEEYSTSAFVYAVSARAALARGAKAVARDRVAQADRLIPKLTYVLPWIAVATRLELAHLHLAFENPARADELLRELSDISERRPGHGVMDDRVAQLRHDLGAGRSSDDGWASTLTPAELRLLPLLASHLSFREIAERLGISRNTVKTQAISVYRKFEVSSRSAAIERAKELGFLQSVASVR